MGKLIKINGSSILLIFIMYCCNLITSSTERFSTALDIKLPPNLNVIKDERQDCGPDFAINYDVRFNDESMAELTESIRSSKFYNEKAFITSCVTAEMFVEHDEVKAVWAKSPTGYVFRNQSERVMYSARIDTINNIAKFKCGVD